MKSVRGAHWIATVALGALLACWGCAKEGDLVVARVGYTRITLGELRESIRKTAERYRPHDKEGLAKQRAYLDVLIDKTLLVREAYARGLDRDSTIVAETADYELGQLLQNLYKELIRDKATVTDEEIERWYAEEQLGRRVHVHHITVRTQEDAQKALAELKGGKPFEEVAREHSSSRRVDVGWYRPNDQGVPEALRGRLFELQVGEVSEPVQVGDTYEIVRVAEEEHVELGAIRSELMAAMRQKKEGVLRVRLDEQLRGERRPVPHPDAFAVALKRGETAKEGVPEFTDAEGGMPLYTFKGGRFTLGEYRRLLAGVEPRYRPPATDSAAVNQAVEHLLFRHYFLAEKARSLGIHKRGGIVKEVRSKKEELMVTALRQREVLDHVAFSEEQLQKYYDEHRENYMTIARVEVREVTADTEKEALEALAQIKVGADLSKLGARPHTYKQYERARNALAEAAFAAKVGDVVGPIEKDGRLAVFKVQRRTPSRQRPFEEVEKEVAVSVRGMLEAKLFNEYVTGLRQKYGPQIQVYDGVLALTMADEGEAQAASGTASPPAEP